MSNAITPAPTSVLGSVASSLLNSTSNALASATTTKSDTPAAPDLSGITDEITEIIDQIKLNQSGKVTSFEKQSNDVRVDNNMTARDIGVLKKNNSRLNLFSALSEGDAADVFRFRINTTSATKIGTLIADPEAKEMFRVQIFSKSSGKLLVDNDPEAGDAYARFTVMSEGKLEMQQGDYVMRISRKDGADAGLKKTVQYAVQLTQGTFINDFDTIEKGYRQDQDQFGFTSNPVVSGLMDSLSAGSSFISSLPAIGTSATSKLNGALYDALF